MSEHSFEEHLADEDDFELYAAVQKAKNCGGHCLRCC
jgi:hypothetical protein